MLIKSNGDILSMYEEKRRDLLILTFMAIQVFHILIYAIVITLTSVIVLIKPALCSD